MLYTQVSELQAMQRAQVFLDDNTSVLGEINKSKFRGALDDVVSRLNGNHVAQHSARDTSVSRTGNRETLQDTLRLGHMKPVVEIARSKLVAAPDIIDMQLPSKTLSGPRLVARARAMANAAERYKQVFLDEQLPQDFVEQLRTAADAVEKATLQRDASRSNGVAATEGVGKQVVRGRLVMRVLDAMVVSQLLQQPELLRQWRFVKHVQVKPGVPRGTTRAETPTAPEPVQIPAPTPIPVERQQPEEGELAAAA
jgi:hypothetical protein